MPSLAIIGAGAAGLAAAHALQPAAPEASGGEPSGGPSVTVFEKSRGVSGRAATRWRDAEDAAGRPFRWRYDHGAQYASPERGSRAHRLLTETLDATGLVDLSALRVWPFDDDGTLRPDRARQDAGPRLTYRDGIATLGRRLLDAAPQATLRGRTRVGRVDRGARGLWRLGSDEGNDLGAFDAVLFTPPPPQTLDLLGEMDPPLRQRLEAGLGQAAYRSQFTVVLAFAGAAPRPEPYALVNADEHGGADGGHPVAWLAVESDKPGRAPEGATLLLAQMSAAWTEAHYDEAKEDVVTATSREVAGLLGADLPTPLWADTQRWRYALPDRAADADALEEAARSGLFFAGDALAGKGRVHLALESGMDAADRIRTALA